MIKKQEEITNCPFCQCNLYQLKFSAPNVHAGIILSSEEFNWVRCLRCQLYYLRPRPKEKDIKAYYPVDYYHLGIKIPATLLRWYRRIYLLGRIRLIKKYSAGKKLLDVGSGEGGFIKIAREYGFDTKGIEPSIDGKKLAAYNFKTESFDTVTLWHVLEHLHDPLMELLEINRILKKEGRLFIAVPNFQSWGFLLGRKDWFHLDTPRHLIGFKAFTLINMLKGCGFKVKKVIFPALENPYDLWETVSYKFFKYNRIAKIIFFLPIFSLTLILKIIAAKFGASETMQVVACKE